ncbi:hypothetical protein V6N11_001834 [Hibiscus sabdariffa]|uniref:Uncharacterized protein n=1 Tax=Hibiscus sabdariffa TaxID=183260 RepID=A0ABR2QTM0_9ROSI
MKSVKKCGEMQENISDNDFSVQKKHDIPIYKGKESVKEGDLGYHEKRNQKVYVPRKIQGHVVDEQLWELKRCLVGVMATVEEEAMEAILLGKDHNNDEGMLGKEDDRHLGDVDLLGCSPIKVYADNDYILKGNSIVKEGQGVICGTAGVDGNPSCFEVVSKQLEENNDSLIKEIDGKESVSPAVKKDFASSKLLVNNQNMGLKPFSSEFKPSPIKSKSSWAATVDERMNASYKKSGATDSCNLKQYGAHSEEGEAMTFFPELAYLKRKKKDRRFGSLLEFQEKVISDLERKKRDRALRKHKVNKKTLDSSELSGRSLSDSDLMARWEASIREERKALELGKSVGLQIVGDEKEVVREMALLDAN